MGCMDATLFVHPAQLMDCNSKEDQMDYKFYPTKILKIGLNHATFLEAKMWANRPKPMQVVVNLVNK